jgi:membrane-associated protease RseP (regulator of RpoE activity)
MAESITLFALGVWRTSIGPGSVGPIASVAIGVAALVSAQSIGWSLEGGATASGTVLGWVGLTNIGLAVFNAIPAYPLDGPDPARDVWAAVKDIDGATKAAVRTGQVIAVRHHDGAAGDSVRRR